MHPTPPRPYFQVGYIGFFLLVLILCLLIDLQHNKRQEPYKVSHMKTNKKAIQHIALSHKLEKQHKKDSRYKYHSCSKYS